MWISRNSPTRRAQLFDELDKNGNGQLTPKELHPEKKPSEKKLPPLVRPHG